MHDPGGAALANNSITTKGANQYLTPVSGTMAFDTDTGAGIAAITEFWLYNTPHHGHHENAGHR